MNELILVHKTDDQDYDLIRQAKQEWESTVDSLSQLICLLDEQKRILRANRTLETWQLGRVESAVGQGIHDILHPDCSGMACYFEDFVSQAWKDLRNGHPAQCEAADSLLQRHILVQLRPISTQTRRDGDAQASFAVLVIQDITKQTRAAEELYRREQFLALLNDITHAALETPDLATMLQTLADRMGGLFGADGCHITLWDKATETVAIAATSKALRDTHSLMGSTFPGLELTKSVIQTGQPIVVQSASESHSLLEQRETGAFPGRWLLGLPLIVDGQNLGAAIILSTSRHHFTPDAITRGQQAAGHVALAIAKAQSLEAERTTRQYTEALYRVTRSSSALKSLPETLQIIVDSIAEVLPADRVQLIGLDMERRQVTHFVKGGPGAAQTFLVPFEQLEHSLSGWALREMRPALSPKGQPDLRERSDVQELRAKTNCGAVMVAPMTYRDKTLGTLTAINRPDQRDFTPQDVELMMAMSHQAAIAIQNVQLYEQAQRRVAALEALQRISLQITSSLSLPAVLDTITESALSLVSATDCHIYLYDESSETFTFGTALWQDGRREPAVPSPRSAGLTATVAREKRAIVINDAVSHPLYVSEEARRWRVQAVAGFPLKRADRVVGVFTIAFLEPHVFSTEEQKLLGLLADQAAIAIENAHLIENLEAEVRARTAKIIAEQEKSQAILSSVGDAIAMTDLDLCIQYVNQAFTSVTGYAAQEILGQEIGFLSGNGWSRQGWQPIEIALTQAGLWQGEWTMRRKDGRTFEAAVTVAPMRDDRGQRVGYVFSHRDISRLKDLDRARSQFIINVSHQLRTPMTNLRLYTHLLKTGLKTAQAPQYLEILEGQINQLDHLIQDTLEMATLDGGGAVTRWEPLSLSSLIETVVARYTSRARDSMLALTLAPCPENLPLVRGDQVRLAQALSELVANAITFTPPGGSVTIAADTCKKDGWRWATLAVQDTGSGILPDEQPWVFDRFFRGRIVDAGHIPGTGLGLSIAHEILRAHGGHVTVESSGLPGQGSTFTLWLPAAPVS